MYKLLLFPENLFFKTVIYLLYCYVVHSYSCPKHTPFKLTDNSCASFNEICIKTDNAQCKILLDACEQCPSSNFTAIMLMDIMNFTKVQPNYTKEILNTKFENLKGELISKLENSKISFQAQYNESKGISDKKSQTLEAKINAIIPIIIITLVLVVIVLVQINKRRFRRYRSIKKDRNDEIVLDLVAQTQTEAESTSLDLRYDFKYDEIINRVKQLSDFNIKLEAKLCELENQIRHISVMPNNSIKFEIVGVGKLIELPVSSEDNIIKIKRRICSKWINAKSHDYKTMKLRYKGNILDDNQYVLHCVDSLIERVQCEFDITMQASNIIVLQLQGNKRLPEMIQMCLNETVFQLKTMIISKFNKFTDLAIFKELTELSNDSTLAECGLMDFDWITVIEKINGKLTINSIFDEDVVVLEYVNISRVGLLKRQIAQRLNCDFDDLFLVHELKNLDDDMFLFTIAIDRDSVTGIRYFNLKKLDSLIMGGVFAKGDSSELFISSEKWTGKEMIMKRYELGSIKSLNDNKFLLNDLIKFLITDSHPKFVKYFGIYHEDRYFFIGMEQISGGSLEEFLSINSSLPEIEISRITKQILHGLSFLHENGIIHGDVKPSNILLDSNHDIKLSIFGLSKYKHNFGACKLMEGLVQAKVGTLKYMAPEIINNKPYGIKIDVWSLGATLVEIVTGKPPCFGIRDVSAGTREARSNSVSSLSSLSLRNVEHISSKLNYSPELRKFIDLCLTYDPTYRPDVQTLLGDAFVNMFDQ